jgi:hypothetical protein
MTFQNENQNQNQEAPKKMFLRVWTKAEMSEENFWKNRTRADWCDDLETAAGEYWMERDYDQSEIQVAE